MAAKGKRPPNIILRKLREERGWSPQRVSDELRQIAETENENRIPGVNANMVGVWERGWKRPSPFYQAIFCQLYHRSAAQLGFVRDDALLLALSEATQQETTRPAHTVSHLPQLPLAHEQTLAIDLLCRTTETTADQQTGAWLTLGASGVGQLLKEGWTLDEVLTSLQVLLQSTQVMPSINRRQLMQLGSAAVMNSIPMPMGERVSEEERVQLTNAFGKSIGAGWKFFHTASNAQILAVGQAQLYLVQEASSHLYPSVRSLLYSSVYNLIGAAFHFQGRYSEAYQAHERAYIAALEGADTLSMAQSRSWQANGLGEQERHLEALQTIEAALRLISSLSSTESIRLQAHLFASSAEMVAFLGEDTLVQKHLDASQTLLSQLPYEYNEEFDHFSWHQYKGACALILKQNEVATEVLQQAIDSLPTQSMIRHVITLMPLAIAYARGRNRDHCVQTMKKAASVVKAINAPGLNRQFAGYIQQEILVSFPDDREIRTFIADIRQEIMPIDVAIQH